MIRGCALGLVVLGMCVASGQAAPKPTRGKPGKPAAHRVTPTLKPSRPASSAAAPFSTAGIAGASYIPIGASKRLPRGFVGPRPAPNRAPSITPEPAPVLAATSPAQASTSAQSPPPTAPAAPSATTPGDSAAPGAPVQGTAQSNTTVSPTPESSPPQQLAVTATRVASAETAAPSVPAPASTPSPVSVSPAPATQDQASGGPTTVGEEPDRRRELNISALADRGGVLTPRGTLVVSTGFDYTHTSVNRFFFDGIELADAVLVGDFQADDIDRNSVSQSFGMQFGLTGRLAMSAGISAMSRTDRRVNTALSSGDPDRVLENEGAGFGDVDFGFQYQINKPKAGWAYYIANLRFKANTGKGPFDIKRNLQNGLETELPTGSGFWSVEPSVTVTWPSDPAVLYGNLGYRWNIKGEVNKVVKDEFVDATIPATGTNPAVVRTRRTHQFMHEVDPGDSISASMGMGFGLNDQISMSLGYAHAWVLPTSSRQTESKYLIDGTVFIPGSSTDPADLEGSPVTNSSKSSTAQVGSIQFGTSVNVNQRYGFSVSLSVGVTSDAPDMALGIRLPLSFRLLD